MTSTPAGYLKAQRLAAGMTLDDVALCVDTVPPIAAARRAELLADIEAGLVPVDVSTAVALAAVPMLGIRLDDLAALVDAQSERPRLTPQGSLLVLLGRRS